MEDIGLIIMYILLGIAIVTAVVLPLVNALKEPKSLLQSLIGVGVIVGLFFIAYAISGNEVTAKYQIYGVSAGTSKLIGAGLISFYVLFVVSLLGIIFSEISKALK